MKKCQGPTNNYFTQTKSLVFDHFSAHKETRVAWGIHDGMTVVSCSKRLCGTCARFSALAMAFSAAAVATFVAVVGGFGSFGGWYAGRQSQVEDPVLPAPEPGSLACPEKAQCVCP